MGKARKRKQHRVLKLALLQEIIRESGVAGRQKMSPGRPHFTFDLIKTSTFAMVIAIQFSRCRKETKKRQKADLKEKKHQEMAQCSSI